MLTTELHSSDGRRWLVAGLSRSDSLADPAPRAVPSLATLAEHSTGAVLFLESGLQGAFDDSREALWPDVPAGESTFMVLVPGRTAPRADPDFGDPATSFLCSADVFSQYLAMRLDPWPQTVCFALLRAIADGRIAVDRLLVRQLPDTRRRTLPDGAISKALLMPHRGDPGHLRSALTYLGRTAGNSLSVGVGLDVEDASEFTGLVDMHPRVKFFQSSPAPVGPYVIRQELAERSCEPLICLQDSDDLSCYDRFAILTAALAETGCGVIGSHELCLDEMRAMVYPVRYPIDASGTLAFSHSHALLHATLMARREAFFECGGLSTDQIVANDTQFMLRAFFTTRIGNVDEFLYIRRRHPASLTNAPETECDNPLRRSLDARWSEDFEAVKRGEMKLEDSSLRPMRRREPYRMERFVGRASSPARVL
jgi:hypothetical protein